MSKNIVLVKLGKKIKEIRSQKTNFKNKPFSQENLAFAAELSVSQISKIEIGKSNISILNLVKIAKALEVKISDLVEGIDEIT